MADAASRQNLLNGSQMVEVLKKFKSNIMKKAPCLLEGIAMQEAERGIITKEHVVGPFQTLFRRIEKTPIKCNDIFKPLPAHKKPIRSALTKGIAGIGKTVSVQAFILDWAEGKENQDIHLIFPLPFRVMNLMKDKQLSLLELIHVFSPETKEMEISSGEYKVLFIFDGLDECRLSLDFHSSVSLCDVNESASVDMILTNLIAGNLLPSALIWITSRPAAADLIPSKCIDRVIEEQGFNDPQKEEYFKKRIRDESLSNRIISHLKSSRSLYTMCHIPVFCWILATILERMLSEAESEGEIPRTLTQMYTHFLIIQINIKHEKNYEDRIFKLGKLAFEQLVKGNLIFYDEDLRECGIDVAEASVYSGLCTQIFIEEFGLYQGKAFCFVHRTIQEHLAALYVHLSFIHEGINAFIQTTKPRKPYTVKQVSTFKLHQRAIDEALQSKNGHLDIFLRFLLGQSNPSNLVLLQGLTTQTGSSFCSNKETLDYIKKKSKNTSPEKAINLLYCLNELGDRSVIEVMHRFLKSRGYRQTRLSSSHWSALAFVLLTSEQKMDVFKLNEFVYEETKADEVLLRLMAMVHTSKAVQLQGCKVTDKSCPALASALRSNPSHVREINLGASSIGNSGLKLLSTGLEDAHCNLNILGLNGCGITDEGCATLASALRSNASHLKQLEMSENQFGDAGVKHLSSALENLHCKLQQLGLSSCGITDEGCAALASAVRSNPSHLTQLEMSRNQFGDVGVKHLSSAFENLHCKLQQLGLSSCGITDEGCAALASALRSNPSHLTQLDLNYNKISDSGVKQLARGLENPKCKLNILWLINCGITDEGCAALASALRSNPSHLTELYLSYNKLGSSGVKLLFGGLDGPQGKLEKIELENCGFSKIAMSSSQLKELDLSWNNLVHSKINQWRWGRFNIADQKCVSLASVPRSTPSHLKQLNLASIRLGHSGVKLLCNSLENSQNKLEILRLYCCGITDEGCAALASALKSNTTRLRQLDLSDNMLKDSGVNLLCAGLENPNCILEGLRLIKCCITAISCAALASALKFNPSHLTELNLSQNSIGMLEKNELYELKDSPDYKLERVIMLGCYRRDTQCVNVFSMLRRK
ncbi:NACHT, LRR and PYD domains-containing protein 3-like [Triplophysa dalaica]|uniref:NACHT, LRR and PYD domains-containing protein 3-like n=1 Tax=Triplophysa dalaica TaxID=1582913 RepID=UPI0024E02322|nr:NACHT, LRR and PYD domains-containing protein 3-like [Triplophysa dalaica]